MMKKMQIFEPAMCCSTGLCGVSVDTELLRISTVLNALEKNGVTIDRFNLSSTPQEFVTNKTVNDFIKEKGVEGLPLTVLDGEIVITGRYPANEELVELLEVPSSYISDNKSIESAQSNESKGCGCSGGKCC